MSGRPDRTDESAGERARPPRVAILAAGASERLGTCKALAPLGDGPATTPLALLAAAVAGAQRAAAPAPLVITGAHHAEIEAAVTALAVPVELVRNDAWRHGRTGSVLRAHRVDPSRDLCVAPADVPLVTSETFRALLDAWNAAGAPARGWLAPRADGRFGHPIVIGRELLSDGVDTEPDLPLRSLRAHADPCWAVDVADRRVLDDLDTPEDLARLRERFARS